MPPDLGEIRTPALNLRLRIFYNPLLSTLVTMYNSMLFSINHSLSELGRGRERRGHIIMQGCPRSVAKWMAAGTTKMLKVSERFIHQTHGLNTLCPLLRDSVCLMRRSIFSRHAITPFSAHHLQLCRQALTSLFVCILASRPKWEGQDIYTRGAQR